MFAVYKELHPPTGIEHCLYCNFFNSSEKQLLTAATNYLHVYRLNDNLEVSTVKGNEDKSAGISKKSKLECMGIFQLFGNVVSMQSIRLHNSSRDSLVLTFQDAKLSVIEYDPEVHSLKTLSLHYFEEEEHKDGRQQQCTNLPSLCVDPEGRCAAMLIYGSRLVILPFGRTDSVAEADSQTETKSAIQASFVINLNNMDEGVRNVIDIQFLHGYYEPTLLLLYEPSPTWPGRVAVRHDSCCILSMSLNLQEKVYPVIWSQSNLPFDCLKVLPVPKPIGGILVMAVNSLIYMNQSLPPYGVSFSQITDYSTEYPLKRQEGTRIQLDGAFAHFITYDALVISLKGGELYIVTLLVDNMRAVRSFHVDRAAASVLPTCLTVCDNGHLFLGSRLGNSLLLKFTEKESADPGSTDPDRDASSDEPPAKRQRKDVEVDKKDNLSDWMAGDVAAIDDLDELEVYGIESNPDLTSTQITQFVFEVCDSIINIGPCGHAVMGEPAFLSDEFHQSTVDLELVSTSGYGKNGAISVLQRSIRPQVISTFELPGCVDMWTLYSPSNTSGVDGHAFLVISRDDGTMVLNTGKEITELDQSGFLTQEPTVYCGNMGGHEFIVQVSLSAVRLLRGAEQVYQLPFPVNDDLVMCSMADPYLLIGTASGATYLLKLVTEPSVELQRQKLNVGQASKVQSLCMYKDTSGLFARSHGSITTPSVSFSGPGTSTPKTRPSVETSQVSLDSAALDEDDLLYGDSDVYVIPPTTLPGPEPSTSTIIATSSSLEPGIAYWVVLALDNGALEIYSVPDVVLCYSAGDACTGPQVLKDDSTAAGQGANLDTSMSMSDLPVIRELLLLGMGGKQKRPHLWMRAGQELFLYEVFPFDYVDPGRLRLRFKKIQHNLLIQEKKDSSGARSKKDEIDLEVEAMLNERIKWLRPFESVSGYSGVFICGPYPYWVMMTYRGILRFHPQPIDGMITSFAPFDNVNCSRGFLYFNKKGELRICALPTHLNYDSPWPVRKVPLRCTPHNVVYHVDSKTYSVVTSTQKLTSQVIQVLGEGEKEFRTVTRDEANFNWPTVSRYNVQLFSPVSWDPIPNTIIEMEPYEQITCIKYVNLNSEGTVSGKKGYIAVGINYNYHEDMVARGRILIFDVIEVVPEPGQPLTKNKIKIEYNKEQKGAVTALESVVGYLITAIGQKVYIWQLKDDDLHGVAFIDTQVYIHQISVVKNLILIADVCKSVTLLRYQDTFKVLSVVTRDVKPLDVYACGFLIHNSTLSFLVSDRLENLIVYAYQPDYKESKNGYCMVRRADFHLGHHVTNFFRARSMMELLPQAKGRAGPLDRKHVTFFTTLSGSIGCLVPLMEKNFRRLHMLEKALTFHIPHLCGLNPKAYRLLQEDCRSLRTIHRNILDGELLWRYLHLSISERNDLFKRMGLSNQQVRDDLRDVDRAMAHF